jgi:hypothetical protein
MPSADQALTQLIPMSLDSSEFRKSEICADQYAVFVFTVDQIIQIIYFLVFIKIFMFSYEIAYINIRPDMESNMLGTLVFPICLILNFIRNPPKVTNVSKTG